MKRKWFIFCIVCLVNVIVLNYNLVQAKSTLNYKKMTLTVGETKSIYVKNPKGKITWKILNGEKAVSLKKAGKAKASITAKKAGKAKVQLKIGKHKLIYNILVKKKKFDKKTQLEQTNKDVISKSVELYAIDSAYSKLKIPSNYNQSYQIPLSKGQNVSYYIVSGKTATITSNGLIKPAYTTWYWNGNVGSTQSSGNADEKQTTQCSYGTTVIQVEIGQKTYRYTITVSDYAEKYADDVMNKYIANNISDEMSNMEKLKKIAEFPCQYDYSAKHSSYVGMIIDGGGDCWASTGAILQLCKKLGFKARSRDARGDAGAGNGHMNNVVKVDNKLYMVDAGYDGNAPRFYSISEIPEFKYSVNEEKKTVKLTAYNGVSKNINIPQSIEGYPLTEIDNAVFYDHPEIRSVTLPDTIQKINDWAFGLTSLQTIKIPAGVTEIGNNAFSRLVSYNGPNGKFGYLDSVELIQIPSTIKSLGIDLSNSVVLYEGTKNEWNKISFTKSYQAPKSNNIFYVANGLELSKKNIVVSVNKTQENNIYSFDPNITVSCSNPEVVQITLKDEKCPYDYYYDSSNENITKVFKKLIIKGIKEGNALVTITSGKLVKHINISVTANQEVHPNQATPVIVKKVSQVTIKEKRSRKAVIRWKSIKTISNYEVQYADNKAFKNAKRKLVKTTSSTLQKLKKEKNYFIRVRAYKVVNNKKVYGAWSTAKKIKIKK